MNTMTLTAARLLLVATLLALAAGCGDTSAVSAAGSPVSQAGGHEEHDDHDEHEDHDEEETAGPIRLKFGRQTRTDAQ